MIGPSMSVILISANGCRSLEAVLHHLRAQPQRALLEVVIVTPMTADAWIDERDHAAFQACRLVAIADVRCTSTARAAGIRAARAPIVALAEDHCLPAPGWAAALIDAHREPWAAVGPVIRNGNPGSSISWANFLLEYGRWAPPLPRGEADALPGRNSSYKRDLLLEFGPRLEAILDSELVLQQELQARGHRLLIEPRAAADHVNVSERAAWLPLRFHAGRVFADARVRGWTQAFGARGVAWRRLLYVAGGPLIPIVRLRRILRDAHRLRGVRPSMLRLLPALVASLVADACGEIAGYAAGRGGSPRSLSRLDLGRADALRPCDRHLLAAPPP